MNDPVRRNAVVVNTMAASALINSRRRSTYANPFEDLISGRRLVVSFVTVANRWVAVTAIAGGLELVSDDKVFVGAPGLALLTTRSS